MKNILLEKAIDYVSGKLVSIKVASILTGVCQGTIYYRINAGKLKVHYVAGYPFLLLSDVKQAIKE